MKIRISTLLLTYSVFLHLGDSNAMYRGPGQYYEESSTGQGSSSNYGGNQMNQGSYPNSGGHAMNTGSSSNLSGQAMHSESTSKEGENHIIYFRGRRIDLRNRPSLEGTALYHGYAAHTLPGSELGTIVRYEHPVDAVVFYGFVPIELWLTHDKITVGHAYFPGCYFPHMSYYRNNNFLTRWVRLKDEHNIPYDMVVYVGDQGRLIGVRPTVLAQGKKTIQITPEKWIIVRNMRHYEVFVNAKENRLTGIQLENGNKERHVLANTMIVDVGNIKFMVYSNPENCGNPSGAELVGNNVISIGEKFDPAEIPVQEKVKAKRGRPKKPPPEVPIVKEKKKMGRPRKNPTNEGGTA